MKKAFRLFDREHKGHTQCAREDLNSSSAEDDRTDEELREMLQEADTTGKGWATEEDFLTILKRRRF